MGLNSGVHRTDTPPRREMEILESIISISALLAVFVAAVTFIYGINAWKREYVVKHRMELSRSVLVKFYEAEDAIKGIRSPFSYGDEGKTRKSEKNETEEESKILDRAYVTYERYLKKEELFSQLRSFKYQFMATFDEEAGKPFEDLTFILNRILEASETLATYRLEDKHYRGMSEDEREKHTEGKREQRGVIWYSGEDDEIVSQVSAIVKKVEEINQKASTT